MQDRFGQRRRISARGVLVRSRVEKWPDGVVEETSSLASVEWDSGRSDQPHYLIEWVDNLDRNFIWPDLQRVSETISEIWSFSTAGADDIIIPTGKTTLRTGRSCARLNINGLNVILGEFGESEQREGSRGFLLYLGAPEEEVRREIRECLSYCLGDRLLLLESAVFDSEWKHLSVVAVSCHGGEQARQAGGRPPAPLGNIYEGQIDPARLCQMITSLLNCYHSYRLQTAFWNYWHAITAPVHMAAAHFGAAIESLQQAYIKSEGNPNFSKLIVDERTWEEIRSKFIELIRERPLEEEERRLLTNKLSNLNVAPQSVLAERFFGALGLEVGTLERRVWNSRNRAAHGGSVGEEDGIRAVRENKVLQTLLNRTMLALSGCHDRYYDYYTLGRPVRSLVQPIPDDRPT